MLGVGSHYKEGAYVEFLLFLFSKLFIVLYCVIPLGSVIK